MRHRPGLSTLFAGPTGTGKTLTAEVMANALRPDLHRIDLRLVASQYAGETEKHLPCHLRISASGSCT